MFSGINEVSSAAAAAFHVLGTLACYGRMPAFEISPKIFYLLVGNGECGM
jgi:hypothetical protein